MRIGFTGTASRILSVAQFAELTVIFARRPKAVLIHGGCIGADNTADALAAQMGIDRVVYPASNVASSKRISRSTLLGRTGSKVTIMLPGAALFRNKTIVEMSDVLIACPKSATEELRSGTWATVRYARKYWREDPARVKVVAP